MAKWIIIFMTLLYKIVLSNTGCAPLRYDIAFYLVKDSQVSYYPTYYQVEFAKRIVDAFTVGYTQTRFSCHTYGSTSTRIEVFDFLTKTTKDTVKSALDTAKSTGSGTLETIYNTRYIWDTIFTSAKGDRSDITNYCFMMTSGENNYTYSSAGVYKPSTINLRVIDAQAAYETYWTTSQWSRFANKYDTVPSFSSSYLNSLADAFTVDFSCNYFCDVNYFAYDEPDLQNENTDPSTGKLYLLTDLPWEITCCGSVTSWIFYAKASGTIKIGVFRPTGTSNEYRIVGFTTILVPESYIDTLVTYPNVVGDRIAIKENDKIGWYSATANIIPYATCTTTQRSDCPQTTLMYTTGGDIEIGDTINFASAASLANRAYALKFTTANNSELSMRTNENETELEENTAVGTKAIYMTIVDDDAYEDYEFTVTGSDTGGGDSLYYFELNQEKMTLDLKNKLPKGLGSTSFTVTIAIQDTCQHSATVTLTVGTYNEPPIINNLPYIYELSEETKSETKLFQINVTDATKDEICCTMPFTLPNTFNFVFKTITVAGGNEELWLYTIPEPAFEYSDIDSFRVFVCCQDPFGSSYSYLIVRLIEVKEETPYVPPDWFFRALYISMMPIAIMMLLSCFTLIFTVFWL